MSRNEEKRILSDYKTVAVVGLSREPDKASYQVSAYLKAHGYTIIPVNAFADEVLGEKSYTSLLAIPAQVQKDIEIVDIFRPSKEVPQIVDQAIQLKRANGKPKVVWMQVGIENQEAAQNARKEGLTVIMNKCMMTEHHKLQ